MPNSTLDAYPDRLRLRSCTDVTNLLGGTVMPRSNKLHEGHLHHSCNYTMTRDGRIFMIFVSEWRD